MDAFDDNCQGCKPAIVNAKTGELISDKAKAIIGDQKRDR
jgi:hypothetical protein